MTFIANDIKSFVQGSILHPGARVKVKGDNILFITSKADKVKEGLKDFGRLLGNGLRIRNFNSASNRDVCAKLVEYRQRAQHSPEDQVWASFGTGRGRLIKPDAANMPEQVKAFIKDVLNTRQPGVADHVFGDPTGLEAALAKAYRYEKRVWAFSNGFDSASDTWSQVVNSQLTRGNSTHSLDLILQGQLGRINSALIYADDVASGEFENRVEANQAIIAQALTADDVDTAYVKVGANDEADAFESTFDIPTFEEITEVSSEMYARKLHGVTGELETQEIPEQVVDKTLVGINYAGMRTYTAFRELVIATSDLTNEVRKLGLQAELAIKAGQNHEVPYKQFRILSQQALDNIGQIFEDSEKAEFALFDQLNKPYPTFKNDKANYDQTVTQLSEMVAQNSEYFQQQALEFESLVKKMDAHFWDSRGEPRPTRDIVRALGKDPLNHPVAEQTAERILAGRTPISFNMTPELIAEYKQHKATLRQVNNAESTAQANRPPLTRAEIESERQRRIARDQQEVAEILTRHGAPLPPPLPTGSSN